MSKLQRYVLKHTWEPLFSPKLCTWIGLNPSIADETQLDPTLRRIRAFSAAWGYNGFIMTNLFGLVSTDPAQLYMVDDPARNSAGYCRMGVVGGQENRCVAVLEMISGFGLLCLKKTKEGYPNHPLYVAADTEPTKYIG